MGIIQDVESQLLAEPILERRTHHQGAQQSTSYFVSRKREIPVQAREYSTTKLKESSPPDVGNKVRFQI